MRLHWSPVEDAGGRFVLSKLSKTVSVPPVFPVSPMVPQFKLMSPSVVVSLGNAASHYHGRCGCAKHDASQPHMFHSGRRPCTGVPLLTVRRLHWKFTMTAKSRALRA